MKRRGVKTFDIKKGAARLSQMVTHKKGGEGVAIGNIKKGGGGVSEFASAARRRGKSPR